VKVEVGLKYDNKPNICH